MSTPKILVIVHEGDAGLGRLGDFGGLHIEVRRPDLGEELPADLSGYDGFVVLGGSMSAWDDDVVPWLARTRRLLAEAVERSVPTLGICLGAQLLAMATGGVVGRGEAGLEVGTSRVVLLDAATNDPFFSVVAEATGGEFAAVQWHQDAITMLPPGAVLMATGERYPHQGYRLGDAAWAVQYHPEVSAQDWADWMRVYWADDQHPDGATGEEVDAGVRGVEPELAALARAHVRAFRSVVSGPHHD